MMFYDYLSHFVLSGLTGAVLGQTEMQQDLVQSAKSHKGKNCFVKMLQCVNEYSDDAAPETDPRVPAGSFYNFLRPKAVKSDRLKFHPGSQK